MRMCGSASSRGNGSGSPRLATQPSSVTSMPCSRSSRSAMRIAFIVQRYGADILGGSEYSCRLIAERMASRHEVEVLTTCARDYVTWKNEYAEGMDRIRGVAVRRFAVARERDIATFNRYSNWIFHYPHTADDELEWLTQQGPWCPALLEYLERCHSSYDLLIFFTYLYAPTVLGLKIAPSRSILVPTAHDEPAIRLDLYKEVFSLPAAMAYQTNAERRFVSDTFRITARVEEVIGCGVDLPPPSSDPRRRGEAPADAGEAAPSHPPRRENGRSHSRGWMFRRRHRLYGPMVLYGGRIDPGKGCEELFEYFSTYAAEGGDAMLVLMGAKLMPIPDAPSVRFAGLLSEVERTAALEAATVVAVPSPFESLSLLALESFAAGTPILANARSEVVVEHCRASNAGLYYADKDEFVECLKVLLSDARLRASMGRHGRDYVRRNYRWDVVLSKYEKLMAAVRA
ncbi:MAG: glycosyltransferase [Luteitalea sp.]|nr:glycosyltransferase [Luteitalea sp.]